LGHVIRKGKLADLSLSGRISGKPARDTRSFTLINNFKHLYKYPGKLRDADRNSKK